MVRAGPLASEDDVSRYEDKADTRRPILTPEGGTLTIRVAGPVPRAIAWTIDLMIRLSGYFVLAIVYGLLLPEGTEGAVMALTLFAGEWLYYGLFEGFTGATPGKKRCGLLVVQQDGSPCGLEASFVRNIVRFVDFLPPIYGFGLMSLVFSPEFQRLGDRAAGTFVVYGKEERPVSQRKTRRRGEKEATLPTTEPQPLPIALTGEEEAAVLEFARRARDWGDARADEIANLAEPLTKVSGRASRQRLLQYAQWLEERGS